MEHIKVAKVEGISILHHGTVQRGTLHLTAHHLIFRREPSEDQTAEGKGISPPSEIWIAYPIIAMAFRYPSSASAPAHIRLRNRDFSFLQFRFDTDRECRDVFDSIRALTVYKSIEKVYAFYYQPMSSERRYNGWTIYDPIKEFERMGVGTERCPGWRVTRINKDYTFSPTYPAVLVVPATISDTTLTHAKVYRSRARIPALTYIHPLNNCTITRCAQPLTGVRGNRCIQDEKLVAAIFASSQPPGSLQTPAYLRTATPSPSGSSTNLQELDSVASSQSSDPDAPVTINRVYGAQQRNLIVDARPTVNAYAMQVVGMGSEDMDNYKHCSSPPCTKTYLGIDNIHVMRDSLNKVIDAIKDSDLSPLPPNRELLAKSGWLKHIGLVLDGTSIIVRQIALEHSHVLLHCSDGWDRTAQLSSLAQICLDPYFRTIDGFIVLVEKDWVSFGYRFRDRAGYLGHDKWFVEKSGYGQPVPDEGSFNEDDEADKPTANTSASGVFGEAFGQAKNFFSNVSNGRSSSPAPPTDGEDTPYEVERRTKAARAAETPMITKPKEVSPAFQQFLDCTVQLMSQYPNRFEYNERFLRRLLFHAYSCQYGTFLHNNELERRDMRVRERTRSVWDYFLARRKMWLNENYDCDADGEDRERELEGGRVIFPKTTVKWWAQCWGREDEEMNGPPVVSTPEQSQQPSAPSAPSPAPPAGSPSEGTTATSISTLPIVGGVVDSVRHLAIGDRTPARKVSQENLGTEMM